MPAYGPVERDSPEGRVRVPRQGTFFTAMPSAVFTVHLTVNRPNQQSARVDGLVSSTLAVDRPGE